MNTNTGNLLEQIIALENDGIHVTIGHPTIFFRKKKYAISLYWISPHHFTSGMPAGSMGDTVEFDDYSDFPKLFEETIAKFKAKIDKFLGAAAI